MAGDERQQRGDAEQVRAARVRGRNLVLGGALVLLVLLLYAITFVKFPEIAEEAEQAEQAVQSQPAPAAQPLSGLRGDGQ